MVIWRSKAGYSALIVFLSMCLLVACSKSEQEYFASGLSLLDSNPKKAVEELSKSLYPEDPDLPSYWFAQVMNQDRYEARGRAYLALGQIENAESDFKRLWPDNLGDLRISLGDHKAAIAAYSEHIANPWDGNPLQAATSYISRGKAYTETGDYDNANADLDYALDITLNRLELERIVGCPDLGIMDRPLGEHYCGTDAQIEEYKSIQGWVSTTTAILAYKSRAEMFMATGEYSQALRDYKAATSYDDSSHGSLMLVSWLGLGNAHRVLENTKSATIAYTTVIEAINSWPELYGETTSHNYHLHSSVSVLSDAWKFRGEIYIEDGFQELGDKDLSTACMYGVRYTNVLVGQSGGLTFEGCNP